MCFCGAGNPNIAYCTTKKCQEENMRIEAINIANIQLKNQQTMNRISSLTADMPISEVEVARKENLRKLIEEFPLFLQEYQHIAKIKWVQYNSLIAAGFTPEQALHLVK